MSRDYRFSMLAITYSYRLKGWKQLDANWSNIMKRKSLWEQLLRAVTKSILYIIFISLNHIE